MGRIRLFDDSISHRSTAQLLHIKLSSRGLSLPLTSLSSEIRQSNLNAILNVAMA
jgi:hypothetical protein